MCAYVLFSRPLLLNLLSEQLEHRVTCSLVVYRATSCLKPRRVRIIDKRDPPLDDHQINLSATATESTVQGHGSRLPAANARENSAESDFSDPFAP